MTLYQVSGIRGFCGRAMQAAPLIGQMLRPSRNVRTDYSFVNRMLSQALGKLF
jgi:hypothetical protein